MAGYVGKSWNFFTPPTAGGVEATRTPPLTDAGGAGFSRGFCAGAGDGFRSGFGAGGSAPDAGFPNCFAAIRLRCSIVAFADAKGFAVVKIYLPSRVPQIFRP
jgi:hypothetical protein